LLRRREFRREPVENGQIVQRGSERELLTEDGPFRRLAHALEGGEPELAAAG